MPGWRLHPLSGNRKGFWAVRVSGNWRIAFRFVTGEGRGRITPSLALRLQAVGWSNAPFWVRLQADYNLDQEILRQGRAA